MTELEIVLNGIEEVEKCGLVCGVDGAPCHHFPDSLISDIKNLLKELEAVEPGIAQDVDGIFATCGNCKKKLWKIMGLEFVINPNEMPRFCQHCGKAVKWE